jgi:pSer/pThr/pTyr-binding forkhead associated (FHA) protein
MSRNVILKATEGNLEGQEFVVPNRAQCVIGRSRDCTVRVPDNTTLTSRHHCALEVDWPAVHVQDLGSLNGTYVNGYLIGRRAHRDTEATLVTGRTEWNLRQGDFLRIGENVFRIEFEPESKPGSPSQSNDRNRKVSC